MFRKIVWLGVLGAVLALALHVYVKAGFLHRYKKHHPGKCSQIKGVDFGSEDIHLASDGLAFITSGVDFPPNPAEYHAYLEANNVKGQIFLFDFKNPGAGAKSLKFRPSKNFSPDTFRPHGLSLLEDTTKGEHLVYVINHAKGGKDRVEKFRFHPKVNELEHLRFFNSTLFRITNDLAVVSEDKYYISNYLNYDSQLMGLLETMLPLPFGDVLYVDGDKVSVAAPGLHGANGLMLSKNKKFLYVALPLDATMHVYERQPDNGLRLVHDVTGLYTAVDNFHLSREGDYLVTGAHPVVYKTMGHFSDLGRSLAPSSVLMLPLSKINGRVVTDKVSELFYDHGDLISGSSIAVVHSNGMLVGSVMDKLVFCDFKLDIKP